jgi:hypothetical protein
LSLRPDRVLSPCPLAEHRRIAPRIRSSAPIRGILTVAGFCAMVSLSLPAIARGQSPAIEQALVNMLRTLPPDAVVIGVTDEFHFGLGYLQGALGERPDVATITTPQLGLSFYRERIRERIGIVVRRPEADEKLSVEVAELVLATGRPLFIDPFQANIAMSFPTYPYGLLFRVLPRGTPLPPILEVFALNQALYERYELGYEFPGVDDQLAAQFHTHYARAWKMIAEGLARAGRREEQAIALQLARALAPR